MSPPSSGSELRFCLPPAFTLVSCSAYYSILKMEAKCSSEMSVDFKQITRRYNPEDSTFHNQRCENLKSYIGHDSLREVSFHLFTFPTLKSEGLGLYSSRFTSEECIESEVRRVPGRKGNKFREEKPPVQRELGAISSGVNQQKREVDHSPPSNADFKNGGAIPKFPHTSSCHGA
jgi:hypothetical protein